VADCELIRRRLVGPEGRWSLLGQSYGGFCATTYLSTAPEHVDRVMITGGVPPLDAHPDDVYRLAYAEARRRSHRFSELYPSSYANLQVVRDVLAESRTTLPDGDVLNVERLQRLGLRLGGTGGYASLGYLLEDIWDGPRQLSDRFLLELQAATSFRSNPLFPVMLEPCYAQGQAPRWSAARVRDEHPDFAEDADSLLLTAEMMAPATFEGHLGLSEFSDVAHLLAELEEWPALYDTERLGHNQVPVAALVYAEDMYVPPQLSLDSASRIGSTEVWTTNEYEHDGLRRDGGRIFDRLLALTSTTRTG
jgi:pimeloyl-ACP methyl ester carboxylesterase